MADLIRVVERLVAPLRRRVLLMVSRAVVRWIDDAPQRQRMQVEGYAGEILDDVERVQQYGLSTCPPLGSDAVVLAVGGMRQHPLVIAAEDPSLRPRLLARGEVILYTAADETSVGGVGRHHIQMRPYSGRGAERRIQMVSTSSASGARAAVRLETRATGPVLEHSIDASRSRLRVSLMRQTDTGIVLQCGRSSIHIADTGITLTAPAIRMVQAT